MRPARGLIAPLIVGLVGSGILVGLGVWQLQRLDWKEALIAEIEARLAADPVPLPAEPDPAEDDFLRVAVSGTYAGEAGFVLTTKRPWGPGYRTIAAVETEGRTLLADLGYVPEDERERHLPEAGAAVDLTGALFWPEGGDSFTPDPDLERRLFFSREVGPLARALGTDPVLVVAESHSLGTWPRAERLGVNLPNNHRNYAITWFSLAVVWAAMSALWARSRRRGG